MATKFGEGDTVSMQGLVTLVHENGTVTVRLDGLDYPITTRAEYVSLVARKQPLRSRGKPLFDKPD